MLSLCLHIFSIRKARQEVHSELVYWAKLLGLSRSMPEVIVETYRQEICRSISAVGLSVSCFTHCEIIAWKSALCIMTLHPSKLILPSPASVSWREVLEDQLGGLQRIHGWNQQIKARKRFDPAIFSKF